MNNGHPIEPLLRDKVPTRSDRTNSTSVESKNFSHYHNHSTTSKKQPRHLKMSPTRLPPFPELPTWGQDIRWFNEYKDIMSTNEAAHVVQRNWLEVASKVDGVILELCDIMQEIDVPEGDMVGFIRDMSMYQGKPTFFRCKVDDDGYTCGMKRRHNTELVEEWKVWIEQMQALHESLSSAITRYRPCPIPQRIHSRLQAPMDSIDLSNLKISRPALCQYDLRVVFREMLEHKDRRSECDFDVGKQVKAFLSILFEAIEDASKISDAEAEALFDQMVKMDLEPGIAESTDSPTDQLHTCHANLVTSNEDDLKE